MLLQNVVFAVSGSPGYSDPLSVVLTYHAENQGTLAVASGLEAFNMVLLLLFITALHGLVKRRGGWLFTYYGRHWKPSHRRWISLTVSRRFWSTSVAHLDHCKWTTTHSWIIPAILLPVPHELVISCR